MDKYEYNLKLEEIDKLVDQGDYQEAANLADTIDWKRVRNIRTLCLISEIYEAAGRLEDSKTLLLRAYRRSPVGRTVLYRLVEVTTALGQYDEAIEYYSEYVQAAPHDNNRYILKYKIYKGRGSQIEELIAILEEYLGQEYTERWAYELATLYKQAGQMQKCLAACDDLVLWFHSGKYVKKALELKKRYAALTPKQQQIYEDELRAEAMPELDEEQEEQTREESLVGDIPETDGEVIAESIIAQTEKEIADQVTAHKAQLDEEGMSDAYEQREIEKTKLFDTAATQLSAQSMAAALQGDKADKAMAAATEAGIAAGTEDGDFVQEDAVHEPEEPKDLQVELARSMRKIISGVVKREEESEEDIPASVDMGLPKYQKLEMPEVTEQVAGQLSIDDILLSMSDQGKRITDAVLGAPEKESADGLADAASEGTAARSGETADKAASDDLDIQEIALGDAPVRSIAQAAAQELTDMQREALQYTNNPEKLLRNTRSLPTYMEEARNGAKHEGTVRRVIEAKQAELEKGIAAQTEEAVQEAREKAKAQQSGQVQPAAEEGQDDLGKTRPILSRKELEAAAREGLLSEKTIRIPAEEVRTRFGQESAKDRAYDKAETYGAHSATEAYDNADGAYDGAETYDNADGAYDGAEVYDDADGAYDDVNGAYDGEEAYDDGNAAYDGTAAYEDDTYEESEAYDAGDGVYDENGTYETGEDGYEEEPYLTLPDHLRDLFIGFTDVEGLEDQIANAVIQAESTGGDRTSRSGNILIFGAHGSGKTTIATNIAKAVAQDKGSQVMKMAKIYASDLNHKDIASTIAKIAGGTLIIEEAGDLEPGTVEQLTTAMEFRTDGLLIILEDEQKYIHELLMRHPRFTMKFTAQIYIPDYTQEELANFGQIYANSQDYVIGDEAWEVYCQRISEALEGEENFSVAGAIDMVRKAIARSNKFLRKISMGKKRYDENDYVLLFPKDFK